MRKLFATLTAIACLAFPIFTSGTTAEAGGYLRGYGWVMGQYKPVHAYSYSTPTYGHAHFGRGVCALVYIEQDFGSYVVVDSLTYFAC